MIHGLRNDKKGAIAKFQIAKNRLKALNYKYPVIGFTYDSNTKGAHIKKYQIHALRIGEMIAQKNGKNLSRFILELKSKNPKIKIRLIGHSLGTLVILGTLKQLYKKSKVPLIESAYFFGSSIPINTFIENKNLVQHSIKTKLVNYYSLYDLVLKDSHDNNIIKHPIGLYGLKKKSPSIPKYKQRLVKPENHRFANYAKTLKSFP